jgi:hypothetical protein
MSKCLIRSFEWAGEICGRGRKRLASEVAKQAGKLQVRSEMRRTLTPTLSLSTGRGGKREHAITLEAAKQ